MDLEIKDKLALVTGSSRGLGQGIVKSLINVGVINFSKSNTKKDSCRTYFIDLDLENNFYLEIANCPKTIKIIDFKLH